MLRARSPVVLLILLLAAGKPAEAICGAWCGDGRLTPACHDVALVAGARLQALHACDAPIVVATVPQQQNERAAHGTPSDVPPAIHLCSRNSDRDSLRRDVRLVPSDRQPLSTHLRI
jgi:hypothetical protein